MKSPSNSEPHSDTRRHFLQRSGQLAIGGLAAVAGVAADSQPAPAKAAGAAPPKIKLGQIGVGHAHAGKLKVYRESADYEVIGIVESDPQLRAAAQQVAAYRDLPWMTEDELLHQPGLQAVTVETRVRDLLDTAERCIAAGKHVHLDKPAGESLPQYKGLLAAAAERQLLVQMGYMFRYNPGVTLLRRFLREGWLGDVFEAHAVMSKVVAPDDRPGLAEYRGGIMFELGCHVIDVLIGCLGKPDRVHSYSRHSSPLGDSLADNMLAVCEYPRAIATIKSSAEEVGGNGRRHFVLCGTAGTFQIEPLDSPKVRYSLDRKRDDYAKGTREITLPPYHRYVGDAADMAAIIRGEKPCDFSYEHDLAVQETVLQASGLIASPAPAN